MQRNGLQPLTLVISAQFTPSNPVIHLHMKPVRLSWHVPPCWQGTTLQSLVECHTGSKVICNIFCYFTFSWNFNINQMTNTVVKPATFLWVCIFLNTIWISLFELLTSKGLCNISQTKINATTLIIFVLLTILCE